MSNVAEFLSADHPTAFSFEVLPPVRGKSIEQVFRSIDRLMPFNPAYINITTHRSEVVYREVAEGVFQRTFERRRPGTVAIAAALKGRYGVPAVPHLICSGFSKADIENEMIDLSYLGITNLLVLRGDRAKGENRFTPVEGGHEHAVELCRQVEDFNRGVLLDGEEHEPLHRFSFGVAGYPEKHEEAMNIDMDIEFLKAKIDAGAKYVVTQMFFDNKRYFEFVERCRAAGITVPIIPGLKPLTSLTQQALLPKTFHIDLPMELARELCRCRSNEDVKALGVEWGVQQARELKAARVPSIHFYSMNATASVEAIAKAVY
ncbi:MAG: methylenetetrahydrofolate reductase [Alistipes sp.]|jgi:methylenetetrahydrofolate reductase (NADPH)|nr:methylenetetrahydrofolate reductase [NAD(P)H] [Alistipes sp.]MBQ5830829.1 methylenetetrahydrofolate reductase [NAD(P)H] [Alistipes sp.]MBQ6571182.1 methylenetetrahydrofolate reductase [NAD(P)H] [Alistipes sp.]